MRLRLLLLASLLMLMTACSTLKIVPLAIDNATIDTKENSLKVASAGVSVTAAHEPIELYSQNLVGYVTAFRVTVGNDTEGEVAVEQDSFILLDEQNHQYFSLMPAKVKEILSKDSYYLIPYPYVGFYYLEDYEKSNFINRQSSNLPYYYEVHPQEIFSKAFPLGQILPNAKVTGLVYFNIDPAQHTKLKLYFYKKGTPKTAPPDTVLPFSVQK